jgi:hypothetical protein
VQAGAVNVTLNGFHAKNSRQEAEDEVAANGETWSSA